MEVQPMKVVKSYSALTICSDLTIEQIKQAKKFAPDALTLFEKVEGKKIPVFKLMYSVFDDARIDEFGIVLNKFDGEHKLYGTMLCVGPCHDDNRSAEVQKQEILDNFAKQLVMLKQIEDQVTAILEEKADLIESIEDCVEVQA